MVFVAFLSGILLAASALARPSSQNLLERRRVNCHHSLPRQPGESVPVHSNTHHVDYDSSWAGAVLSSAAGTYSAVTATFVVPTSKAHDSDSLYSAFAWVGLDGYSCTASMLNTGVDFIIADGYGTYIAWYQWWPNDSGVHSFSHEIQIKAGDTIKLTVTANTTTSGSAVIENITTNTSVVQYLTSSYPLCKENAEWIVDAYVERDSFAPLANFGITFSGSKATTKWGTVGPSDATVLDLKLNKKVLTSVSTNSSSVTVKFV